MQWKITHRMECQLTEYDLRVRFLTLEAVDRNKQVIGTIKINLYHIWRGPFRINLPLEMPDSSETRISFNFKISQTLHLQMENT
jgi:hypothetical protein